jgi:hypothetical protein
MFRIELNLLRQFDTIHEWQYLCDGVGNLHGVFRVVKII